jgi:hypothetical protein
LRQDPRRIRLGTSRRLSRAADPQSAVGRQHLDQRLGDILAVRGKR